MLFLESDEPCETSYKDRGGKYQGRPYHLIYYGHGKMRIDKSMSHNTRGDKYTNKSELP